MTLEFPAEKQSREKAQSTEVQCEQENDRGWETGLCQELINTAALVKSKSLHKSNAIKITAKREISKHKERNKKNYIHTVHKNINMKCILVVKPFKKVA